LSNEDQIAQAYTWGYADGKSGLERYWFPNPSNERKEAYRQGKEDGEADKQREEATDEYMAKLDDFRNMYINGHISQSQYRKLLDTVQVETVGVV